MAWHFDTATPGVAAIVAGVVNSFFNAHGYSRRRLMVQNNTGQTQTITLIAQDTNSNNYVIETFTLTTAGFAQIGEGVGFASAGTYTRTLGAEALLNGPADQLVVQIAQNPASTGTGVGIFLMQSDR